MIINNTIIVPDDDDDDDDDSHNNNNNTNINIIMSIKVQVEENYISDLACTVRWAFNSISTYKIYLMRICHTRTWGDGQKNSHSK
jgi:hypothetical protein